MFDQEPLHNFRKSPDLTQVLEFDSSEQIIIPSSAPYVVRLKEVPDCEIENQRPMITGFIEVYDQTYGFVSPDQSNQFWINYNTGDVIFNELNADQTIFISYYKKGTYFEGKYINDIVNVLSDITETLIDHTHDLSFIDADELNGHDGTYYLDYSNFINVPDLTGNLSASELLSMILGVDGTDSELDADLFDGRESSEFADSTHNHDNSYSDLDHSHNDLYSILGHSHPGSDITGFVSDSTNADLLDGYDGTYYLDYNNFINTPDTSVVVAQHDALSGINESDSTQFHLNKNQFNQLTDLTDTTIHNHDSFYYTKSQIDISLSGKSDLTHDHDLEYSETDHSHSDLYSDLTHFHVGSDITSAVANANDADTLDGTHSSGFAASGHNHDSSYSGLIHYHSGGDITTSVSDSTNSDKLDGQHGSYYLDATHLNAGILPSARFDDTAHGSRAGGSLHSAVTASVNGFMLASDKTKLDAIESGATADMSASEILTAIKSVDGTASGLDADLLDGQHGSYYSDITARLGYTPVNKSGDTMSGVLVIPVGSVSAPSLTFVGDTSTGLYRITTNEIGITTGGTLAVDIDSLGDTNIYGRLRSSGNKSRPSWNTTGCAFDSAAATFTDTDGTGVISTIRCANTFNKPTFSSSNDVTINNAATVYINDAPVAGTNTTIINRWALRISAGDVYIGAGIYFGGSVSSSSWTTLSPKFHMPSISLTDTDGTGTISSRMAFSFYRPTFASSNSVTITNAATLYIGNPPLAGANTTITNAYSLQIQGGNSQFGGDVTASNFIGGGSGLSSVNALAVSGYPIWKSGDNQTCIPIISLSGNTPVGYTIDFYNEDATESYTNRITSNAGYLALSGHLTCGDTTLCTNLNADLLDGTHSSGFAASGHKHDSDYLKLTGGTLSGALNVQGRLQSSGNQSMAAWGIVGISFYSAAATFTNTSSTGTVANTVANSFLKPTFASSNSVTITSAATVYIADAPGAGTNTTITDAQALKVNAGNCYFGGDVQASTFTGNGAALTNVNATTLDSLDSADFVKIATGQTITAAHTFTSAGGIAFNLGSTINYLTRKTATDELLYISGGTSITDGGTIALQGGTHGTYPGSVLIRCGGAKDIGDIKFQSHDGTVAAGIMYIDKNGNVIIGPNVAGPASGTRSLGIRSGTAPSTMKDMAQIYAADIVAGKCAIHCQAENGDLIKLYTTTALTAQLTTITHTAPAAEDFAISAPINTNAYGFANANEFNTCMKVIANLQTRLSQVETRLQDLGLLG